MGVPLRAAAQKALVNGLVIPAHPLALTSERKLDERAQRALTRYYAAAGAGGIAVGVHTTQFEIREPRHGLLRPVLELAAQSVREHEEKSGEGLVLVAGVCGRTQQAVAEASFAREAGYDVGLVSLAALADESDEALISHCEAVASEIPVLGFYLQSAVGGRRLGYGFWRRFVDIPRVVGIKVAPFDRYRTLDVLRAVGQSGRADDLALYTGNDDNIVVDLLTEYRLECDGEPVRLRMSGGLLGHWAVWTKRAVALLDEIRQAVVTGAPVPPQLLSRAVEITDCNAAIFDAAHGFAGCIAGIHEVLRRQGLMQGTWCLDESVGLSPGQVEEIDRVCAAYPHLIDDDFVAQHRDDWLS